MAQELTVKKIKLPKNTKAGKITLHKTRKVSKTADKLMLEAWETTYTNHQKDIERANKLLLRAWQKTYENRHHKLD
jgi:hypothetical protein